MTRANYLFTSESVSEGHPDKVCDRISDEVVDLFFREAETQGFDPWRVRVACETLATTNRVVIAGEFRGPGTVTARPHRPSRPHGDQGHRLRAGRLPLGARPTSRCCCTPSRPTSRKASTPPATRTRAPATRASCSATPADETPELMPAPILYAHKILETLAKAAQVQGQRRRQARPGREEPGHGALRERQAGRGHADRALDPAPRRRRSTPPTCGRSSSPTSASRCPAAGSPRTPSGTSIRPASS